MGRGKALCAGRERCLVGDGRGRKQEEDEVAVATSPSYKCEAGVTAFAITPARF